MIQDTKYLSFMKVALLAVAAYFLFAGSLYFYAKLETPIDSPISHIDVKEVKTQQKETAAKVVVKDTEFSKMKAVNTTLQKQLFAAQKKNAELIAKTKEVETPDTLATELSFSATASDSLCNLTIVNLEDQLNNRDTVITMLKINEIMLSSNLNTAALENTDLLRLNRDLKNRMVARKVGGTIVKATLLTALGYLLLKK